MDRVGAAAHAQAQPLNLWNFPALSHWNSCKSRENKDFHASQECSGARAEEALGAALLAHRARILVIAAQLESRLADDRLPDCAGHRPTDFSVPAQHLE